MVGAIARDLATDRAAMPVQDPRDRRWREPPLAQQAERVSFRIGDLAVRHGRLPSLGGD